VLERQRFALDHGIHRYASSSRVRAEGRAQELPQLVLARSHSASSSATESSAHSVVPLKARITPVG
jgi:hypothetical protein